MISNLLNATWYEKRRLMMTDRAKFLARVETKGEVIDMQSKRAGSSG